MEELSQAVHTSEGNWKLKAYKAIFQYKTLKLFTLKNRDTLTVNLTCVVYHTHV